MVEGPLKIWPFPILTKLMPPTIKDHEYTGKPTFDGNYKVVIIEYKDGKVTTHPFTMKLAYDTKLEGTETHNGGSHVFFEKHTLSEGAEVTEMTQDGIDEFENSVRASGYSYAKMVVEQIEPR